MKTPYADAAAAIHLADVDVNRMILGSPCDGRIDVRLTRERTPA